MPSPRARKCRPFLVRPPAIHRRLREPHVSTGPAGSAWASRPAATTVLLVPSAVPAWIRDYRGEWVRPDVIAGLTLAAYLLPAGLADASLAGLPPEAGLYACLFARLVFGFFFRSQHPPVTLTTAVSLLTRAAVGAMRGGGPAPPAAPAPP